jgi:hypothetical protein
MKKKSIVKCGILSESVLKVLTNEWQTASLIASQIEVPPDAIARTMQQMEANGRRKYPNVAAAKTQIVARRLNQNLRNKQPIIEKRKVKRLLSEYRLIQPAEEQPCKSQQPE